MKYCETCKGAIATGWERTYGNGRSYHAGCLPRNERPNMQQETKTLAKSFAEDYDRLVKENKKLRKKISDQRKNLRSLQKLWETFRAGWYQGHAQNATP